MMHKLLTFCTIVLAHALYGLSFLMPRSKKVWVFIGWQRTPEGEIFTDNTKYLYLYISKFEPHITPVWLAKSESVARDLTLRGYTSYYEHSARGIWYALRAGVTVLDAYLQRFNYQFSGGSIVVQLIHGKGMKQAGYADLPFKKNDYLFLPSPFVAEILSDVFKGESQVHITGYPRSDGVLGCDYEDMVHVHHPDLELLTTLRAAGVKCYWYAPTFRRGQTSIDLDAVLNISAMSRMLKEQGAHLFVSLHPKYRSITLTSPEDNIHILQLQDFFPLYQLFDVLITDYSSSFTDFVLLNRPIIFYPYDLEAYREREGISVDYDAITPGPKVFTSEALIKELSTITSNDTYKEQRKSVCAQYHSHTDPHSASRIMEILNKEVFHG